MKNYDKTAIKLLRQRLEFGDVKRCADDLGISTVTVHNAMKGDALIPAHRLILDHLSLMVEQAEERKKKAVKL